MKIHIRHHLASPCKGKRTRKRKKILNQTEEASWDTGKTHTFTPQKTIHHNSTVCPKCKSTDITQIGTKKRNMVSIPPPQEYNVTEHILHKYACKSCKKTFENDGKLSPRGQFDVTVIRSIVNMFSKKKCNTTQSENHCNCLQF